MSTHFDTAGNEYRSAEVEEGQRLVWAQTESEEGELWDGELRIINKSALHDTPPRRKLDAEIAELHATGKNLARQIWERQQGLAAFERDADARMAKLKRHKALERLDDFIEGRITHYVWVNWGPPTIERFEDAASKDENRFGTDKLKLLTLFGRADGDLEWGVNQYTDGSGHNTRVIPCQSHDEAVEAARALFAAHEIEALDPKELTTPSREWVKQAEEYGIAMSSGYLLALKISTEAARRKRVAELTKQLGELQEPDAASE